MRFLILFVRLSDDMREKVLKDRIIAGLSPDVYNSFDLYTLEKTMRTNVVIDDQLMETALKVSGCRTKKEAVEAGLHLLVRFSRQKNIRNFRGKLKWTGDLDQMRTDK